MAFKAITVNTPAADPAHILAEDDAALYESLVGGDKVLNVGGKLAATTISNNKIRITDGVVIVGGHVGRIYKGDYEDLTIENGTSGQNRNDLIVARYLAGNSGGADSYGLAVIKGTPGSTATDPIYMQGNLYNGDPQRDFPLYRAKLEGLSIVAVEQLFEVGKTIGELEEEIETLNSNNIVHVFENRFRTGIISRRGNVKMLVLNTAYGSFRSGQRYTLGTLDQEYCPIARVEKFCVIATNENNTYTARLVITTAGVVYFTPYTDRPQDSTICISETYI